MLFNEVKLGDYRQHGEPFDAISLLKQRGKVVEKDGHKVTDTFLQIVDGADNYERRLYQLFNNREARIKLQKACREKSNSYKFFDEISVEFNQASERLYTSTFEWYVKEIFMRELRFQSASFRVLLRDGPGGGDFDVIGFSAYDFVFVECKTGNPHNIKKHEIKNFIKRSHFLNNSISIFYVDTSKLDCTNFDFETFCIDGNGEKVELWEIKSKSRKARLFHPSFSNIYIIDCSSNRGDVIENLRFTIDTHHSLIGLENRTSEVSPLALDESLFSVEQI